MDKYRHIFFDLDRTLWDFDSNSGMTLRKICRKYKLDDQIDDISQFINDYHIINAGLWDEYRKGRISKDRLRRKRFELTLGRYGIKVDMLIKNISDDYLKLSPLQTILLPHTMDTLKYLFPKYSLYILTNGFETTQRIKLKNCELDGFFKKVISSEMVGYNKPRPEIFHYAISSINARKKDCLMIGDDLEVDILGAREYGIDQVYYNIDRISHNESITYEIKSLSELRTLL